MTSRLQLKTRTVLCNPEGESCPPPVPRKGTVWEFQRVDILPSKGRSSTIWHTYVLVQALYHVEVRTP